MGWRAPANPIERVEEASQMRVVAHGSGENLNRSPNRVLQGPGWLILLELPLVERRLVREPQHVVKQLFVAPNDSHLLQSRPRVLHETDCGAESATLDAEQIVASQVPHPGSAHVLRPAQAGDECSEQADVDSLLLHVVAGSQNLRRHVAAKAKEVAHDAAAGGQVDEKLRSEGEERRGPALCGENALK